MKSSKQVKVRNWANKVKVLKMHKWTTYNNHCQDIIPSTQAVYHSLMSHANDKTLEAFPKWKTIQRNKHVSHQTVKRAIDILLKEGLIERTRNYASQRGSRIYKMILDAFSTYASVPDEEADQKRDSDAVSPHVDRKKEKKFEFPDKLLDEIKTMRPIVDGGYSLDRYIYEDKIQEVVLHRKDEKGDLYLTLSMPNYIPNKLYHLQIIMATNVKGLREAVGEILGFRVKAAEKKALIKIKKYLLREFNRIEKQRVEE